MSLSWKFWWKNNLHANKTDFRLRKLTFKISIFWPCTSHRYLILERVCVDQFLGQKYTFCWPWFNVLHKFGHAKHLFGKRPEVSYVYDINLSFYNLQPRWIGICKCNFAVISTVGIFGRWYFVYRLEIKSVSFYS